MSIAEEAKHIYENELREKLEADHCNQFVAIEPVSGEYFLGTTFLDAALSAKNSRPDHKSFVIHIGNEAAFHMGSSQL